jgi:anti-anti-sigma regulatory factor
VVGVDIVTSSPDGTAEECENQDSGRPSGTAPNVYALSHGLTSVVGLIQVLRLAKAGGLEMNTTDPESECSRFPNKFDKLCTSAAQTFSGLQTSFCATEHCVPAQDEFQREKTMKDESSKAMRRWEDDGGPPPPPTGPGIAAGDSELGRGTNPVELIVLPFSDYSAQQRERLQGLRERFDSYQPDSTVNAVVVDTTRVERCGAALAGVLHSGASIMKTNGRKLVLVGDLGGVLKITRLNEVCPIFETREAAFRWCTNP